MNVRAQELIMATVQDQLDALRELLWLYSQVTLWGAPRRFEYAGAHVKAGEKERRELAREIAHAQIDASRRVRDAQKRLLATGFPVPDSWLTARVVGQLSTQHTAAGKGKKEMAVLVDSGADLGALETVCREISVAMLRLEAQLEPGAVECRPEAQAPVTEPIDVPLTLAEFIASHCACEGKLTESRLESLTKSLQGAARRKGSGVALPRHVGSWRPGRKKYYHPSQLRAVWPGLVRHLPYLPPLKSFKP